MLAEPAALLASELVTDAVVHADGAGARVELRGSLLQVAVHDQDPNLRLLAANDGTDRGLGLQIVDQVRKAWGVRRTRPAASRLVHLDLPPPQAARSAAAGGPRSPRRSPSGSVPSWAASHPAAHQEIGREL